MPVVYDAFISYSHAKDKPIAAALQAVIQKLGKPWYRRRGLRVFRDDTSLSATPHLWPSIEQALSQSRYLILLTSPEAAASPWVGKEIEYWLANKSPDTLFIGCTDGELSWDNAAGDFRWTADTPLTEALKGKFAAEPKWVDLRAFRDGADPRNARFIELGADFAAAIHGLPKEDLLSQEVRQQRRALTLAVSAAALLFVLAIGAVTAGIIAKYQQERAEQNFAAAKDTVNGLIFQIAQGLRDVEGIRVESLDKILGQARSTVERLTETDPDNPELIRSKTAMLDEFAQTYLAAGNLEAALKNAEEAEALMRKEVAKDDGNSYAKRNLSVVLVHLGDAKRDMGNTAGALAAYEESLEIREALSAEDEDNEQAAFDVTVNLERIGDLKRQMGDRKGAFAAYEESLSIRRRLAEQDGPDSEWWKTAPVSLGKICDLKLDIGDTQGALEACNEVLAMSRRIAAEDEGNTDWQRDVALGLERVGHLKLAADDAQGALEAFEESLGDPPSSRGPRSGQRHLATGSRHRFQLFGFGEACRGRYVGCDQSARGVASHPRTACRASSEQERAAPGHLHLAQQLGYAKLALGDVPAPAPPTRSGSSLRAKRRRDRSRQSRSGSAALPRP